MISKCKRNIFFVPLVAILIHWGCSDIASSTPTIVNVATPTRTMSAVPTGITPLDLLENVQLVIAAIETNQPEMLRSLIGKEGVTVGGFAQGLNFKGYNNADEIVTAFAEALDKTTPVCRGFVPDAGALPDKAILVYQGLKFDWSRFGLTGTNSDSSMTFQFFKLPEGWRLVYITPFDFELDLPMLGPLQDCHAIH